jgi:serine/threonine protein kinase
MGISGKAVSAEHDFNISDHCTQKRQEVLDEKQVGCQYQTWVKWNRCMSKDETEKFRTGETEKTIRLEFNEHGQVETDREPFQHSGNEDEAARLFHDCTVRYRSEGLVAQGAMGTVYAVRDLPCDRTVALKLISTEGLEDAEEYGRFINEARITARHEHPNIIPVHELGINDNGYPYYTMKHVRGEAFSEIIERLKQGDPDTIRDYPLGRLLTIFQKACDAVAFAHAHGVIHCDLKPPNIMVGDYGEVLVLDWGLARYVKSEHESTQTVEALTTNGADVEKKVSEAAHTIEDRDHDHLSSNREARSHTVTGTPAFLAPEVILSVGAEFSPQSDVYALGAILYLILTLRSHAVGSDLKELLTNIVHKPIRPPSDYNETAEEDGPRLVHCPDGKVPFMLSEIAMRALRRDPTGRYPSVPAMQKEIEQYQDGRIWHPIIFEDFGSEEFLKRWEVLGGKYEWEKGVLRLHGGEPQLLMLRQDLPGDVRVEFECSMHGSYLNDLACLINGMRSDNPWMVSVSGYSFKYGAYTNSFNVLTRLDTKLFSEKASPLESGRRYRVVVERIGNSLKMWVDHELVLSAYDDHPLTNPQHCAVGLQGWLAETRYYRVSVFALSTPMNCNILDLADRHLEQGHYVTARDLFGDSLKICMEISDEQRRRAEEGYVTAVRCHEMTQNVPGWLDRLQKAWPDTEVSLYVNRHGLTLDITLGQVSDLSPAAGIPITHLRCDLNNITHLEACRTMPLQGLLCSGNPIRSLEPLRGKQLEMIICENCEIESLEPLRGMPLRSLNCAWNPLRDGLGALENMPLTWLSCGMTGADSLEPLRGMQLTQLYCEGNRIESLEPLSGMPLAELIIPGNRIESLEPLRGMPLTNLSLSSNRIKELSPLREIPISTLRCQGNRISSLEPLADMNLNFLLCGENCFTSLEPLQKKPPNIFDFACDTLTTSVLERTREIWMYQEGCQDHARHIDTLIAAREHDIDRLRRLSHEYGGHHYLYIPIAMRWEDARLWCEAQGGHLVTILSEQENEFILSMFALGSWFWIGLSTDGTGHHWVTGEPFQYASFCHILDEIAHSPKVFASGHWRKYSIPDELNTFVIEWDH